MKIRYPNITGRTEAEKLQQLINWLRQLVEELNITLTRLEERRNEDDK